MVPSYGLRALSDFKAMLKEADDMDMTTTNLQYLQMIIVIAQLIRLLKTLAFHPKLALVTETVRQAGMDLIHFLVLFGLV